MKEILLKVLFVLSLLSTYSCDSFLNYRVYSKEFTYNYLKEEYPDFLEIYKFDDIYFLFDYYNDGLFEMNSDDYPRNEIHVIEASTKKQKIHITVNQKAIGGRVAALGHILAKDSIVCNFDSFKNILLHMYTTKEEYNWGRIYVGNDYDYKDIFKGKVDLYLIFDSVNFTYPIHFKGNSYLRTVYATPPKAGSGGYILKKGVCDVDINLLYVSDKSKEIFTDITQSNPDKRKWGWWSLILIIPGIVLFILLLILIHGIFAFIFIGIKFLFYRKTEISFLKTFLTYMDNAWDITDMINIFRN
ncbi:hypothetical protein [Carboxylicivirga caseinilyticus]|uniref:hypothetical protein n=1 Tax=Carboxylicivirga caseinilyticus TaxID=3417572 RepID=UPI003D3545BF|nr:hypothetical protein [Marinilabiliaceae bacterium A049]